MKPLLTALIAFAMGSAIRTHAACSVAGMQPNYSFTAGSCSTAPGVTLYVPYSSALVIPDPFEVLFDSKRYPYAQRSDSPWAAGIRQGSIYVEDFEDGLVNTPGLAMALGTMSTAASVDEDDGILGNVEDDVGRIWYAGSGGLSNTARAEFTPDASGNYPTYAGWVMDTYDQADAYFEAFDPDGNLVASYRNILEWGEWQFVGVYAPQGISAIQSRFNANTVFDHVQYGYAIPEPSTALLTATAALAAASRRRREPARPLPRTLTSRDLASCGGSPTGVPTTIQNEIDPLSPADRGPLCFKSCLSYGISHCFAMSSISVDLENALARLDPGSAAALERLVRDSLALLETRVVHAQELDTRGWPVGYFDRTEGSFAGEPLEAPEDPPAEFLPRW
jgi:hypothetical protein